MPPKSDKHHSQISRATRTDSDLWESSSSDGEFSRLNDADDDNNGHLAPLNFSELRRKLQAVKLQRDEETTKENQHPSVSQADSSRAKYLQPAAKENQRPQGSHARKKNKRPTHHRAHSGYKKLIAERDESPDSQVIESGTCSPGHEGVKRADRKDVHHFGGLNDSFEP